MVGFKGKNRFNFMHFTISWLWVEKSGYAGMYREIPRLATI